jgi:hypothetical protein
MMGRIFRAQVEVVRNATKLCLEELKGRSHSEDVDADGRIMLKVIFRNWDWRVCSAFMWFRISADDKLL